MDKSYKIPVQIERLFRKSIAFDINRNKEKGRIHPTEEQLLSKLESHLNFWNLNDHDLLNFILNEIADIPECLTEEELLDLPTPYRALTAVMNFELHTQGDGWMAVINEGAEKMGNVIEGYRILGLSHVAAALDAVMRVNPYTVDNYNDKYYEIFDAAYLNVISPKESFDQGFDERISHIVKYARSIQSAEQNS